MTGKPGQIRSEIRITTPRGQRQGFDLSDAFMQYKRQIMEILEQ